MIDLYYWPTPNGWKISIFLEESGIPYRVIPVDISQGEQFAENFLTISPNNRMPAMDDTDGPGGNPISIFESGAILVYLAEKYGQFLPKGPRGRYETIQWLMWQMGGVGPMFGQVGHFTRYAPKQIPYAIDRYMKEAPRLVRVLDKRLADRKFVAGDYSIADMAIFPWVHALEQLFGLEDAANVRDWVDRQRARSAVQKGLSVLDERRRSMSELSAQQKSTLFGDKQFAKR